MCGPPSYGWCPHEERDIPGAHTGLAICKPRREATGETNPADTSSSEFGLRGHGKTDFCRALPWWQEQTNAVNWGGGPTKSSPWANVPHLRCPETPDPAAATQPPNRESHLFYSGLSARYRKLLGFRTKDSGWSGPQGGLEMTEWSHPISESHHLMWSSPPREDQGRRPSDQAGTLP